MELYQEALNVLPAEYGNHALETLNSFKLQNCSLIYRCDKLVNGAFMICKR